MAELLAAAFAAGIQHIDHASLVYIGTVLVVLLSGYLLATLGWHVWLHWSLPRIYENQFLESAVLWRCLGFLTMVFFSFGSCWLVIQSFGGRLNLVSESVSPTAIGIFFWLFLGDRAGPDGPVHVGIWHAYFKAAWGVRAETSRSRAWSGRCDVLCDLTPQYRGQVRFS